MKPKVKKLPVQPKLDQRELAQLTQAGEEEGQGPMAAEDRVKGIGYAPYACACTIQELSAMHALSGSAAADLLFCSPWSMPATNNNTAVNHLLALLLLSVGCALDCCMPLHLAAHAHVECSHMHACGRVQESGGGPGGRA